MTADRARSCVALAILAATFACSAKRWPEVSDAERDAALAAASGTTATEIEADKTYRYWEVRLTDPDEEPRLPAGAAARFGVDPEATVATLDEEFRLATGTTPLDIVRMDPAELWYEAGLEHDPEGSASLYVLSNAVERAHEPLARRVEQVGGRVLAAADADGIELELDPAIGANAAVRTSFEADRIYVGPEMVLAAADDDQLACVIGHELAHIRDGHASADAWMEVGRAITFGTLSVAENALLPGRTSTAAAELATILLADVPRRVMGLDRLQEEKADVLAVDYVAAAGFDPGACADLAMAMLREQQAGGGDGARWFRTHPVTTDRAVALRKLADTREPSAGP